MNDDEGFVRNENVPLKDIINDEQLLELVLDYLAITDDLEKANKYATQILASAAVNTFKKGDEFSCEDVHKKMQEILIGHILRRLTQEGMLDVAIGENGEDYYNLTDLGKIVVKKGLNEK